MDEKILKSERYFNEIFAMMRKATNVKLEPKNKTLNGTELRLLSEDGMLVKRPILISGDVVLVGFNEKTWAERLK